jgi:hypothetical protein
MLMFFLPACGGLKYNEVSDKAAVYRPRSIAVLPTTVGSYEQARGIVGRQVANDLIERQWFDRVVSPTVVQQHISQNAEFRDQVSSYILTLNTVGQSDKKLSAAIGKKLGVEALALANVEYWGYTKVHDEKVGKVALGFKYIECTTGAVLWKAAHEEIEDYMLLKPDLAKVSAEVVHDILNKMPLQDTQ